MQDLPALLATVDAVLFDWDGTLADTHAAHYHSLSETLAPHGITVDQDWFTTATGMSTVDSIEWLSHTQGIPLDDRLAELVEECETRYLSHLDVVSEITWVADIAKYCHGRIPIAVASGGCANSIRQTMKHLRLDPYFDTLVSREDVERGKPAPDIFELAAERLGVTPQRCLVIEDSDAGIEAAHRVGASVLDVRDGRPTP
ncbi:HAD family hydrolase [Umezawaea sp. NPDC059074]|uniref:HAD family hydrolase n=1 Tax=Umezawaea sp. NPDC059074 TaxID=3346716 RepID=UPI0036C415C0